MSDSLPVTLAGFGGILRCTVCGKTKRINDAANIALWLNFGWPTCCGYTMRWVTQRELDAEKEAQP